MKQFKFTLSIGVQQSVGWVHYMLHAPEPHVLLFRRPLPDIIPIADQSSTVTLSIATSSMGNGQRDSM